MSKLWCVLVAVVSAVSMEAAQINYNLSLDTAQLAATSSDFQFEFLISGGSGNTVTFNNFNFGSGMPEAGQPATVTLQATAPNFLDSQTLSFTPGTPPGSSVSFMLSTTDTAPIAGFGPDTIQIFLEDILGNILPTSDQLFSSLLTLSLTGGADTAQFFTGTGAPITGLMFTTGSTGSTGSTGTVPEPASASLIALAGVGAVALGLLRRKIGTR